MNSIVYNYINQPIRSSIDSSGYDLKPLINGNITIAPGSSVILETDGHFTNTTNEEIRIFSRSSYMYKHNVFAKRVSTGDSTAINVKLKNKGNKELTITSQDNICQLVLIDKTVESRLIKLRSTERAIILPGETVLVSTNYIPRENMIHGQTGIITPFVGSCKSGVIDADYNKVISVIVINDTDREMLISPNDIIGKIEVVAWNKFANDDYLARDRDTLGFGSSDMEYKLHMLAKNANRIKPIHTP